LNKIGKTMNRKFPTPLKKALFLSGALILGWAARAQSTTSPSTSDTTRHRYGGMQQRSSNRHSGPGDRDSFHGHRDAFHDRRDAFRGHRDAFRDRRDAFHGGGPGSRDGWAFRGGQHIHYTPEQRKQVMEISKDYRQKSQDLFKQDNLTLKQYKAGLIALQKDKKSRLQALLTPQQKDELATRRKRMTENAQVMEAARLERLKLHLNLSDDQVAKIKAGQADLHSQVKAIHENDDLLPQQKMEQMKALMTKRNDTFKSVLTPDQYTQFEQMSHHRFDGK
jgi:hypothetical protein